jgi:DNA-binding NarL/FixJ family response regulator
MSLGARLREDRVRTITSRVRPSVRRAASPETPAAKSAGGASAVCVVVADGAAIDRAAIAALIRSEQDFLVVGEAGNTQEAIERCRRLQPDVLVLTLTLPSPVGEPALPEVRAALPDLPIVAMSERGWSDCLILNPPSSAHVRSETTRSGLCGGGHDCLQVAAAQGAEGTVRRSADPKALFATIRAVASGRSAYEPGTLMTLNGVAEASGDAPLSPRLVEVAHLLADGCSNKEIATALGISEPTVKKHVTRLLERLALEDRLQAGLYIARHPLLFMMRPALVR